MRQKEEDSSPGTTFSATTWGKQNISSVDNAPSVSPSCAKDKLPQPILR